ncbi:MAG: hypothetical protein U0324_47010 [Polyangiales bacterium]
MAQVLRRPVRRGAERLAHALGSAGRDRTYGVAGVDNAAPNAAAVWRGNVLRAPARCGSTSACATWRSPEVAPLPGGSGSWPPHRELQGARDGRPQTLEGTR